MNKTAVTAKVAERSGVPSDVCADVLDALEKVLQDELAAKGAGFLGKIAAAYRVFSTGKCT